MNAEPVRIAQVIGKLSAGGVESVVYNYYRHIDHSKFQFDFIYDADSTCQPRKELINMGARYFEVPPYQKLPQYIVALIRLFKENHYQIVHSHMNTLAVFSLFAAWVAGVPVRICHNHSTAGRGEAGKNIMKYTLRPFAKVFATDYCACSRYAGEWLFGKRSMQKGEITIFHNAIELERFRFQPDMRKRVRKELNLENKFVVGHVGRFCYQKNHEFLIEVFAEVHRHRPEAVLLLVGKGASMENVREKVHQLGLEQVVRFLGIRDDVDRLYQVMDVFVLPSRYEGLGIVNIEAQSAGLPCVVSDCVPKEVQVTVNLRFLPLSAGAEVWAERIMGVRPECRGDVAYKIRFSGFDISAQEKNLRDFYVKRLSDKSNF